MEKPILFSTEMVEAILAGRKTQTRRVIKIEPDRMKVEDGAVWHLPFGPGKPNGPWHTWLPVNYSPYGQPGDFLWVREAWATVNSYDHLKPSDIPKGDARWPTVWYCAPKVAAASMQNSTSKFLGKKRPSIFMPRWASRITLRVNNVRVERVQDIDNHDSWAEGILPAENWPNNLICHNSYRLKNGYSPEARDMFAHLWNFFNAKRGYSWEVNPWVWVIEFQYIPVTVTE